MLNAVIDLSHHNGPVDLGTAKADGILGVIHKASQGITYVDSQYSSRKNFAVAIGLFWGAYHFGDGSDGKAQAAHFLTTAGDAPLLVLDLEENTIGESMTLQGAYDFINTVKQQTGRWPVLYGGFYLRQLLAGSPDAMFQNCPLWLADYRLNPITLPGWPQWTLWQYTDGKNGGEPHEVAGIGPCDRDMFNGDAAALEAFWKGTA